MALKAARNEMDWDVSFFMNTTGERGGIVSFTTAGSGDALDSSVALVTYNAVASGKVPVGILLDDVVDIDQTRQHINYYKSEVQKGGKVAVLTRGWVVTNMFTTDATLTNGNELLFMFNSGLLNTTRAFDSSPNTAAGSGVNAQAAVGRALAKKDADGYAKVSISLPN